MMLSKYNIILAVFSIALLLYLTYHEKAFAITLTTNIFNIDGYNPTMGGYNPSLEYFISRDNGGITDYDIIDANDLSLVGSFGTAPDTTSEGGSSLFADRFIAHGNSFFSLGSSTTPTPDTLVRIEMKLDTLTYAISSINDIPEISGTTDFNGCRFNNFVKVSSDVAYVYLAGSSCGNRGVYSVSLTGAEWFSLIVADTDNYGFGDGCYSGSSDKVIYTRQFDPTIVAFAVGSGVSQTLSLTDDVDNIYCVENSDKVLVTSDAGDWVKLVDTSGALTLVTMTTISNPIDVIVHANEVYVSRLGTTAVTVCEYSESSTMSCPATITLTSGTSGAKLLRGNSTTFYAYAGNTATGAGIAYAVGGLEADGAIVDGGITCIEVQENGQQVCYEDTDGNGIPNFPNGGFDVIRPVQNITTVGADVLCSTGFSDSSCENDNPRENGVGLILLIIIVLMSYAVVVSIHVGAMHYLGKQNVAVMDYLSINPVLLLVMLIIDVGAAWQLQFIPDIIFYTVIVVMGGLAAWGYFSAIKGRGSSA